MCHPLLVGLKYASCACFVPLRKEFVDCLLPTCTSSFCHPYDCVGYLCMCRRAWDGEELSIEGWEEGVCAGCWEGDVRTHTPQLIRHRRMLTPTMHDVSAKYSTMTRTRTPTSRSPTSASNPSDPSNAAPLPGRPATSSPDAVGSRVRNASRMSGRTYASLADYGYTLRTSPSHATRIHPQTGRPATSTPLRGIVEEPSLNGPDSIGGMDGIDGRDLDYDVRPPTRAWAHHNRLYAAPSRSQSSGSTRSRERDRL